MIQTDDPQNENQERIVVVPDFLNAAHQANHEAFIAAGYKYYGHQRFHKAFLYQRRFREDEQDVEDDGCYINFHQFDMRDLRVENPITYEADVYCSREEGRGFITVEQCGIEADRLAELIPVVEAELRAAWRKYARNGMKESLNYGSK